MDISQTFHYLRNKYSQSNPDGLRNPWGLALLGVVIVFIAVNALFIVLAIISNPGLVVEDYYEQGRQYERTALKKMATHNKLQWETRLEVPATIVQHQSASYLFSAVDRRGLPVKDANVILTAYRPSNAAADFDTVMPQIAPGLYRTNITLPLPGVWDIKIVVRQAQDQYELRQRVSVRQASRNGQPDEQVDNTGMF